MLSLVMSLLSFVLGPVPRQSVSSHVGGQDSIYNGSRTYRATYCNFDGKDMRML